MLYPIVQGDTMWGIAAKYQTFLEEPNTEAALRLLEKENPQLKGKTGDWHWIYPGQEANVIPSPGSIPGGGKVISGGPPAAPVVTVPVVSPGTTVRSYFAAINAHHYVRAWNLGGKNFGGSYASFVAGFSDTLNVVVKVTSIQGGVVNVNLTATHTDHSIHKFSGEYTVSGGIITSANLVSDSTTGGSTAPGITSTSSVAAYKNPLRGISGLQAERIDMGVDYGGTGPLYSIGKGTVVNVYNGGWPGGVFIEIRLTDGPYMGKYVYYAEYITPHVSLGQSVDSNTVIGTLNSGGMEMGWGDPNIIGNAYGSALGYHEGEAMAIGNNFSQFLAALGAPSGLLLGRSLVGTVPPGYFNGSVGKVTVTTSPGSSTGGASTNYAAGSPAQNIITIGHYLMNHGYTKAAAAGIAACIWGESGGNPESVGSGGFGLIGWTGNTIGLPAGYGGPTGNASYDLLAQMEGIVGYNNAMGAGLVAQLNAQTSPLSAAYFYSANFEKPAVPGSDVHPGTAGDPNTIYSQL